MYEYYCPDCNEVEFELKIVPMKKCTKCNQVMNAEEIENC